MVPDTIVKKTLSLIIIMICIGHRTVSAYDLEYRPSFTADITWDDNIEDEPADTQKRTFISGCRHGSSSMAGERNRL
ncbi:MAG: hypothetical protein GTO08_06010 [Deltaproteobacteria bacterium]|nr:hypothetical protein [Deltaproteobacteria bacterium]